MIRIINKLLELSSFFGIKWDDFKSFSLNIEEEYDVFSIKQKNGKKRIISSPSLRLKNIQRQINDNILINHKRMPFVYGFYPETNHYLNALEHIDSNYMINIDIKDFFNSINSRQVYFVFNKLFEFDRTISTALTNLTTLNNALPQGAPTSPMLSNLVFRNIDYRLKKFSDKMGLIYTRYADDLTFSSPKLFDIKYVYKIVENILMSNNYNINKKKTRFLSKHLSVTGLSIVENKVKIPKNYIRKIEQELYYIKTKGLDSHLEFIYDFDKNPITYLMELLGRIKYVISIDETKGKELESSYFNLLKSCNI